MATRDKNRREMVMLAHKFEPAKTHICNWLLSEKLDGQRAWLDGGISRGLPTASVPYANVTKDYIRVREPIATGLWSRYGKVIYAPNWWLDELPNIMLDGELWMGRGLMQSTSSIVKQHDPNPIHWQQVKYAVFDSPPLEQLFRPGLIKNNVFEKKLSGCLEWAYQRGANLGSVPTNAYVSVNLMFKFLTNVLDNSKAAYALQQEIVPATTKAAIDFVNQRLNEINEARGEGVILRRPNGLWVPERTWDLLKYKPFEDDEATVIGYTAGRETDKGSKLLGLMGAMIVNYKGKVFELSGFKDEERVFSTQNAKSYATENPGKRMPDWAINSMFPRGSRVTFRYRELTDDGVPKEARFLRKEILI